MIKNDTNTMKPKLAISFSGGRTSAVMTKLCVDKFSETHDIAITFANTGCEHDNTLKFVDQCDKHFGWNVVWVEALVNPEKGKGIRHRIVDFKTASRNGKPFEDYIKKEGLPGPSNPGCTTRLKELPMNSYLKRVLGWSDYWTAIGIRADEIDRVSDKRIENKFVYPLVDAGWTKEDVKRECASWDFDLDLKGEHYGNCTWCWKKSLRKLLTLAKDDEWIFEFPRRMEYEHETTNLGVGHTGRQIFRSKMTTVDIVQMARTKDFEPYVDIDQLDFGFSPPSYDVFLDTGSACGESCEIGADD
jgi:3'-phosphoadenosine 5'-phosphosulfate sulfotransferase (PAPS reductase)/FAD synthetase